MRIGIYSGSFNPIHIGHISLVDYIVNQNIVDEIWLIRSPQNPLKATNTLLSDKDRASMLRLAIKGHKGLKINCIEDKLPKPNYTINTLRALQEKYSTKEFYLIIGADNWEIFEKWKEWDNILKEFHLIIYPRPGYDNPIIDPATYPTVQVVDAPLFDISSTEIRERIAQGVSISDLVSPKVEEYIQTNQLYKNNE